MRVQCSACGNQASVGTIFEDTCLSCGAKGLIILPSLREERKKCLRCGRISPRAVLRCPYCESNRLETVLVEMSDD